MSGFLPDKEKKITAMTLPRSSPLSTIPSLFTPLSRLLYAYRDPSTYSTCHRLNPTLTGKQDAERLLTTSGSVFFTLINSERVIG